MIVDFDIDIFLPIKTDDENEKYISSSIGYLIDNKKGFIIPLNYLDSVLKFKKASKVELKQILADCNWLIKKQFNLVKASIIIQLDFDYLKENMKIEMPESLLNNKKFPLTEEALIYSFFKSMYIERFKNFLTFTQLAMPGSFWIEESPVYVGKKFSHKIDSFSSILVESITYDFKYPQIQQMDIAKVWNWISEKTDILQSFSNTKIEKALNAFTYLFSSNYHSDLSTSLIWSLIGLEAIYADSDLGIAQQIHEKAQVLLGTINENKKILKSMYNFRSRLLHGELSTPINNGWLESDAYNDEFYKTASFSAFMLTASLQKIIELDKTELNFKYIIE